MTLAWLTLLALVVVVVLSCATRINPGLAAIVLAWLVVASSRWLPPPAGAAFDLKTLWAAFPSEIFLTLLGVSLLCAQAEANGTLARVADGAQWLARGQRGLLPFTFFALALVLGSLGPGNIAAAGLIAPIAMVSARRAGISPLVMALLVGHGAIATSVSPFTVSGATANSILAKMGIVDVAWRLFAWNVAANAGAAALGYLLFGGWRMWSGPAAEAAKEVKPTAQPLTGTHGITLAVFGLMVLAVVAAKVPVGLAAFVGAAILSVLGLADEREAIQRMPWSVLIMICGVSILTALLEKAGGTALFAKLIGQVSTPRSLAAVLAFVTGIVSIYSSTTGVVLPAFLPMVKDVAAAHSGSNPLSLALAVLVGGNLVDLSPLSTIGALCLAAAPLDIDRRLLSAQLFAWGFAMAGVGAAISWLCF